MTRPSQASRAEIVGIKPWKRWQIDPFLRPLYARWHYAPSADAALRRQARMGGDLLVWAAREPDDFAARAQAQKARVLRIEDGFLRSVGLGSNHVGGASLVLDELGIYFDPRRPSALEQLLQTHCFDADLLARAGALRGFLVAHQLSKYNVGTRATLPIGGTSGQSRILVPGQVEDDASVRYGAAEPRSNLGLLRAVRASQPQAWIVYKPHPDTEAGTRAGHVADEQILQYANQILRGAAAAAALSQVDAVHTLTSLLGFEALLRGLPVTAWGQPFYAGWGLTEDRAPIARRTRRLQLDELVAGTLILYPRYIDLRSGAHCEVEDIARQLAEAGEGRADPSTLRRVARLCRGWLRSLASAHG